METDAFKVKYPADEKQKVITHVGFCIEKPSQARGGGGSNHSLAFCFHLYKDTPKHGDH